MKKLKRMLLIHWHNYEKELIEFDMINFLTGKTAAGKSTIIDALQLVLLGDTSGSFFNKAANQKSARTLKSYLFGEMGDDGEAGFRYMRNERFTSYVAVEFEDTERKSLFVSGIVCDCYKDQTFDYKWFMVHNQGFPSNLFVDEMTRIPYDISGLRSYLARTLGGRKSNLFEFYETNKRYQEVTLGKFGQMKSKYRTLLRKAVPFSPIADIEKFITESICDVKNNIDIEQMQNDIRQYKNLEEDTRTIQERIGYLKEIHTIHGNYEREKDKYLQQSYIVIRAELEEYEKKEKDYKTEAEEKQRLITQHLEEMVDLEREIEKVKKELELLEEEYRSSGFAQKADKLKQQLEELAKQIHQIEDDIQRAIQNIHKYGETWRIRLEKAKTAEFIMPEKFDETITNMIQVSEAELRGFDFLCSAKELEQLRSELEEYRGELKNGENRLE